MNGVTGFFQSTGEMVKLFVETVYWCKAAFRNRDKVFRQMAEIGNYTLPFAALISVFVGAALALETGPQLALFGLEQNIGGIVATGMVRELGPVMTSMLVAGRVGSAMTAEIASMSVYQEIDALKTMDINPVRFLVMPRFLAMFITLPFLVIYMDVIGTFGGAVVSAVNHKINVPFSVYYRNVKLYIEFVDVLHGLIKATVFGVMISIACCYVGLKTKGGPREIGTSVTKAVVLSFILILVFDYFITRLLILLHVGYNF
jgi:phospholipid/cholesterol/gamma-HCH transport system permease protein